MKPSSVYYYAHYPASAFQTLLIRPITIQIDIKRLLWPVMSQQETKWIHNHISDLLLSKTHYKTLVGNLLFGKMSQHRPEQFLLFQ